MRSDDARRARFEAVFAEVYQPLQRYLHRRALPTDVDDVLSDTLLVLWRRLDDVPADATAAYAYGVARRTLANHRRGDDRRARLHERLEAMTPTRTGDAAATDGALDDALAALSDDERELVRLWAWEELAPREIAVALGITANAASIRLHRAKAKLAEQLTRKTTTGAGHLTGGHDDEEER